MTIRWRGRFASSWRSVTGLVLAALLASGCSILSQRQVDAVAQFSAATKDFGTSPAAVIRAHGDLRLERGVLKAASVTDPQAIETQLVTSVKTAHAAAELAGASAMDALDDYAEMLGVLSSSKFTDDLQNKTVALGASIDKDIAVVNQLTGSNISSIGDVVAGVVRAAGGIWIRHEQQKALKAAVLAAKEPVDRLTGVIEGLMDEYLPPTSANAKTMNLFDEEANDLRSILRRPPPRPWNVAAIERFEIALARANAGKELAVSCKRAAQQYRAAHDQLVAAITQEPSDLKSLVSDINALAKEIKAGKKVRDEVRKNRKS